jgi:3-deoxy-D-manno-octulosonic-acid transferase
MMLFAYGCFMYLLSPLLLLKLYARSRKEPLYAQAVAERFGFYRMPATSGGIWIHAVSLGETRAIQSLVETLRQHYPNVRFVFTHGTATGRQQGLSLLQAGDIQVWQAWDSPQAVKRFFRHFQPKLGFLVDTEVWPVTVSQAAKHGVPVVLLNARLSARSLRKAMQWSALAKPAFGSLKAIWAQSEQDAKRFQSLGVPVQAVMGNLKFDAVPDAVQVQQGHDLRARMQRPVILLAISREGEEAALLDVLMQQPAYLKDVQWWLVPRHPQRFEDVAALVKAKGLTLIKRSEWGAHPQANDVQSTDAMVLGDSMGEMAFYFSAASVCLLGGSFEPLGGQNLIESCACACPVVMGLHTFNFAQAATLAQQAGAAVRVKHLNEAVDVAYRLALDKQECANKAELARQFATQHQGAVARCVELIKPLM